MRQGGEVLADSVRALVLHEAGHPPVHYLPRSDVRMERLARSEPTSWCPYKGQAEYWSVRVGDAVHEDLAWSYRAPVPESQRIAGLIAFYNEKLDVIVDGVPLARPKTQFS